MISHDTTGSDVGTTIGARAPLGERRISGKEGFDLSSTSYAKSWNREPPAPATGNSHGQLRERPDAVLVQCRDSAGR